MRRFLVELSPLFGKQSQRTIEADGLTIEETGALVFDIEIAPNNDQFKIAFAAKAWLSVEVLDD